MSIYIAADATLMGLKEAFPKPFEVHTYTSRAELLTLLSDAKALICRSTLTVDDGLLHHRHLQVIATASSGIDHIDSDAMNKRGLHLIDAKGSNARSVADYVVSTLALLAKQHGIRPRRAGIIGCGAVGSEVITRLTAVGCGITCYDPPKALRHPHFQSATLQDVLACDVVCVHANLHTLAPYPSEGLLNASFLNALGDGTVIINASRGKIVDEHALLTCGPSLIYCSDVFENEPHPSPDVLQYATLCTPHIAGHSIEAKRDALRMVSQRIHHYFDLPEVVFKTPPPLKLVWEEGCHSWEDIALKLYNPNIESDQLKQHAAHNDYFAHLRKKHTLRHDFNVYEFSKIACTQPQVLGLHVNRS